MGRVTPSRIALVLAAALAAAPGAFAALWVSQAGDDANPGTEEQPVRTTLLAGPGVTVKVTVPELPAPNSVKPVAVTSMICTEVIDGGLAEIVIIVFGLGLGKTSGCGCPLRVSVNAVIVTVIVPATLPT